ncbi:LIPOPROTEIN [Mycoplasmopsis pulmonis]|uniref:LIPOPROTEIN n=1 Tax=Mycoplasmopsis pulmonis (strain UAB CTIP) TaxID=272635 RepID=Q98QD0_MYCPU|nr:lipoprotein 17-related variable surface protein [Mycoplasmopsis pulmonis]CAC13609.1 LIPOPROTEIN [Mycoplasmopsis pulmonis]VEU68198.1 lipoprotein [Mycoplasmopsis pulmonis]
MNVKKFSKNKKLFVLFSSIIFVSQLAFISCTTQISQNQKVKILKNELDSIDKIQLVASSNLKNKLASEVEVSDLKKENFQLIKSGKNYNLASDFMLSYELSKENMNSNDEKGTLKIKAILTKDNLKEEKVFIIEGFKTTKVKNTQLLELEIQKIIQAEPAQGSLFKNKLASQVQKNRSFK